jgi:hypothetical protein
MFDKVCPHCQHAYRLEEVKFDRHWNTWSTEPAHAYCPHCDTILQGIHPDSVDLAKHFKPVYILGLIGFFVCFWLGAATNTLGLIGPLMLLGFGAWLARTAQLRDHRITGWFLIVVSVFVFVASLQAA